MSGGPGGTGGALQIYGSAIDADPAELRSLAMRVETIAGTVSGAAGRVSAARQTIESSTPWAPTSGRHAQAAAHLAQLDLLTSHRLADEMSADLRQAAAAYDAAEERASQAFVLEVPRVPTGMGPVLGTMMRWFRVPAVVGAAFLGGFLRGQWTPSAPQMGEMLQEVVYSATGGPLYPDWAPFADDRMQLVGTLGSWVTTAAIAIPRGFTPHGVEVTRVQRSTSLTAPVPAPNPYGAQGIGDLMAGIGDLYHAEAVPPGTIRIDKITDDDGDVSWQVYIGGTQTQSADGDFAALLTPDVPGADLGSYLRAVSVNDVPQDWLTNLQAYSGLPTSVENGIVQALDTAGVGAGEPILFAGHSQGAMMAMSLASDPRIQNNYDVESVVTFGGPVGHMRVPSDVSVLNVEHTGDLVSGVENTPNPVEPNRFTVERDIAASDDPADTDVNAVWQSHNIPAYLRTAGMIDETHNPVLASWRAQSEEVMADGEPQVSSQYFTLRREQWYDIPLLNKLM